MKQKLQPRIIFVFWWGIFLYKGILLLILYTVIVSFKGVDSTHKLLSYINIPLIVVFVVLWFSISLIWAWLTYRFWRYEFTINAYKAERGVIWKRYISIPYERIQNVDIYRGVLSRLLGLSDLQIHTAGYGGSGARGLGSEGRLPGLSIEDAERIREELIQKVEGAKGQGL